MFHLANRQIMGESMSWEDQGRQYHGWSGDGTAPPAAIPGRFATFDSNGHYDGHAVIYFGQDENGIQQWNNRDSEGHLTDQHAPSERTLPFDDPRHSRINRGDSYYVVE
jgi:hypothetical protein